MGIPGILGSEGGSDKGFSFNYLELAFETVVDPYFDFFTTMQIVDGEIGIEEAYVRTRALPSGLKIKAGQFFSGFGRLNSQHDHVWNFSIQPLVYSSLLGDKNLNEIGIQLTWVAPVDFYLVLGAEVLKGSNKAMFGNESFSIGNLSVEKDDMPLMVGFVKTSFDFDNMILLAGVSLASGRHQSIQEENDYAFSGNSLLYGLELTIKYMIDSYRYLSLQSEYIGSRSDGDEYLLSTGRSKPFDGSMSGLYSELIWRYGLRWRTGVRFDYIAKRPERIFESHNLNQSGTRIAAMIEYNPSEFSRVRLQYAYDRAHFLFGEKKNYHELSVNINVAVGAHGAHKF